MSDMELFHFSLSVIFNFKEDVYVRLPEILLLPLSAFTDLPQDILEIWRQGAALCSSLRTQEEVEMEASEQGEEEERELGRMSAGEEVRAELERETDILEMASERELSSKDISGTSLPRPEVMTAESPL